MEEGKTAVQRPPLHGGNRGPRWKLSSRKKQRTLQETAASWVHPAKAVSAGDRRPRWELRNKPDPNQEDGLETVNLPQWEMEFRAKLVSQALSRDVSYLVGLCISQEDRKGRLLGLNGRLEPGVKNALGYGGFSPGARTTMYNLLEEAVTEKVTAWYSGIRLSDAALESLAEYGDRAAGFPEEFAGYLEVSRNTSIRMILNEIKRGIVLGQDLKTILTRLDGVIQKRREALEELIRWSYGQMVRDMILWEYQDAGFDRYRVIAQPEGCEACRALDGEIFHTSDAVRGQNFPPMHPHCVCLAALLDQDGNVVAILESGEQAAKPEPGEPWHWYDGLKDIPKDAGDFLWAVAQSNYQRMISIRNLVSLLDYLTFGFSGALLEYGGDFIENPSFSTAIRWATMGFSDVVSGAVHPDKPLGFEHLMNCFAIGFAAGAGWKATQAIKANKLKPLPPMKKKGVKTAAGKEAAENAAQDAAKKAAEKAAKAAGKETAEEVAGRQAASGALKESGGVVKEGITGTGGVGLNKKLMQELAESGVKYNADDVVAITKDFSGKTVWLENGSNSAGLKHIIKEHGIDFANKGISKDKIPDYLMNAIDKGKIVGYQGRGTGRPIYEFIYNGNTQRVGITIGDNGFIVGANPVSLK